MIYAIDYGINWDWFAAIELHEDGTATVVWETRLHKYDTSQGADLSYYWDRARASYRIVEREREAFSREPRIAIGVIVDGVEYPLRKPCGRFEFPHA